MLECSSLVCLTCLVFKQVPAELSCPRPMGSHAQSLRLPARGEGAAVTVWLLGSSAQQPGVMGFLAYLAETVLPSFPRQMES